MHVRWHYKVKIAKITRIRARAGKPRFVDYLLFPGQREGRPQA